MHTGKEILRSRSLLITGIVKVLLDGDIRPAERICLCAIPPKIFKHHVCQETLQAIQQEVRAGRHLGPDQTCKILNTLGQGQAQRLIEAAKTMTRVSLVVLVPALVAKTIPAFTVMTGLLGLDPTICPYL